MLCQAYEFVTFLQSIDTAMKYHRPGIITIPVSMSYPLLGVL
jgi:hypothetical protein